MLRSYENKKKRLKMDIKNQINNICNHNLLDDLYKTLIPRVPNEYQLDNHREYKSIVDIKRSIYSLLINVYQIEDNNYEDKLIKIAKKYHDEELFNLLIDKLDDYLNVMKNLELEKKKEEDKGYEEKKNDRYEQLSHRYKKYLENEIAKEVNKINDSLILERIYKYLIVRVKKIILQGKVVEGKFPKNDIDYAKKKICSSLINRYKNFNDQLEIESIFHDNTKLIYALKKHNAMYEILRTFDETAYINDAEHPVEKENKFKEIGEKFKTCLEKHKAILTTRRDNGFETLIKGLGLAAATIFGLGFAGRFAYTHLFGSKATHGNKYINEINQISLDKMAQF